jgi:protein-tyrosine phosphatase
MRASIYWIDHPRGYRLGIMARPRSGEWLADEVAAWRDERVGTVVSLLEPEEVGDLELAGEAELCRSAGIEFIAFPVADRAVPSSLTETRLLAEKLCTTGSTGIAVAIHCRAGIGRSSVIAGAALILSGLSTEDAIAAIRKARGVDVPDTDEQLRWLTEFESYIAAR